MTWITLRRFGVGRARRNAVSVLRPSKLRPSGGYRRTLIRRRGRGFGQPDVEAGQCELSQKADLGETIDSDENPLAINFSVLQSDVKVGEPKGGTFGRHSLDLANAETVSIDPNLPAQKVFIFPL